MSVIPTLVTQGDKIPVFKVLSLLSILWSCLFRAHVGVTSVSFEGVSLHFHAVSIFPTFHC